MQIHYEMMDQHVGTTSWANMLYQLVSTCLARERIDYCRFYSFVEIQFLANKLVQVGPTFHTNFGVGVRMHYEMLDQHVGTTSWTNMYMY